MSYLGAGDVSAVLRPEGLAESVVLRSATAHLIAPGSLTDGRFGLFRWDMAPRGAGPNPHFHRTFAESFFVLSGAVTLYDGREWAAAGPGDFLYVPDGGVHGFRNDTDAEASMLILFAPGPPRERYFRELAEVFASGRTLGQDEWLQLWARHDQYPAAG